MLQLVTQDRGCLNNFKEIAKGVWISPLHPMECEIFKATLKIPFTAYVYSTSERKA
jgi:hypothetical protein